MPITRGAGNADWNWDETLLALDLLYKHDRPIHKNHPDIIQLSNILRNASYHPKDKQLDNFRNPDGISFKLQNLVSAESGGEGTKISSSELDDEIVVVYPRHRYAEVRVIAALIRDAIARGESVDNFPKDEVFVEGYILTSQHRSRDRRLRERLIERAGNNQLICEICDFAPPPLEQALRASFFEAHHIRPICGFRGLTSTRITDMALLCAGCHRFIHKLIALRRRWISIADARHSFRGDL